jgi:hypothetical protein
VNKRFEDKKAARRAKAREDTSDQWLRNMAEETGPEMEAAIAEGGFMTYVHTFIEVRTSPGLQAAKWAARNFAELMQY